MRKITPLRRARQETGLTLREVGLQVDIDAAALSRCERGLKRLSAAQARQLLCFYQQLGAAKGLNELPFLYPEDAYGRQLPAE